MKSNNVLIVIGVVALVGGVAWFRASRPTAVPAPRAPQALPAADRQAVTTSTTRAAEGELCPDPPPAAAEKAPASTPATLPATTATPRKIPRVVDLGADKCKACKELAPILEQLGKEYEGRVVVEFIDVWKNPQAGAPYKFRVIPTQIFFDASGQEVWRHEGFLAKADFVAKFAELGVK